VTIKECDDSVGTNSRGDDIVIYLPSNAGGHSLISRRILPGVAECTVWIANGKIYQRLCKNCHGLALVIGSGRYREPRYIFSQRLCHNRRLRHWSGEAANIVRRPARHMQCDDHIVREKLWLNCS